MDRLGTGLIVLTLLAASLFGGCVTTNGPDKSTSKYKQADAKYQEGEENRQDLRGSEILEDFDKKVAQVWEEGLEIDGSHRQMRLDLAKLYMILGSRFRIRSMEKEEEAKDHVKKGEGSLEKSALSESRTKWERARIYLNLAVKHYKSLRKLGYDPTKLDILMGYTYIALKQYELALAHLKAALDSSELSPTEEKKVKRNIIRITLLRDK